ncbi:hypothetical protein [Spongiimicrobium sp. 3-5]|uniref:hypothetical protein n=1 Tax=Spongiimicrobium sp. 3-5 TaxID=3332596 RepID=UPI003980DF72
MHKILKIVLVVLGLAGFVLWTQLPDKDAPVSEAIQSSSMNLMFLITYLLLAIAVVVSLVFTLKNLFANPSSLKKTLFVIGGFLLVVLISFGLASGTDIDIAKMAEKGIETSESTVKRIGMGLNVFFILTIVAVAAMVLPGIKRMFSK